MNLISRSEMGILPTDKDGGFCSIDKYAIVLAEVRILQKLNYKNIYEDDNIGLYYRNLSRLLSVMKDNVSTFEQQKNMYQNMYEDDL